MTAVGDTAAEQSERRLPITVDRVTNNSIDEKHLWVLSPDQSSIEGSGDSIEKSIEPSVPTAPSKQGTAGLPSPLVVFPPQRASAGDDVMCDWLRL